MAEDSSWGSLGDVLLREGLITDSQLTTALQVQKQTEKRLGRVLVEMGLITERVRMRLLQQKLGYDIVQINPQRIDPMVLAYIPKSLAVKHRLVPIRLDFDTLVVAMEDPTDVTIIDHLKTLTGFRIKPVIASMEDIDAALAIYPEEPEKAEEVRVMPRWLRLLGSVILILFLAAPIVGFFLYVPTNVTLLNQLAQRGFVDFFIFTLLGYGIYAVVIWLIWSLIFQRERPTTPPQEPLPPGLA